MKIPFPRENYDMRARTEKLRQVHVKTSKLVRAVLCLAIGTIIGQTEFGDAQMKVASWLDALRPASWNKSGLSIPVAPSVQGDTDLHCRALARPAESEEDRHVRDQGWDLIGAYQGGWRMLIIRGTAAYDGMCRPRQYQVFVFVRGVFAGTLSPEAMDSRTDGALNQVFLQADGQLIAEYLRYAAKDPLCCPSRTTRVEFRFGGDGPILLPMSASTSPNR